MITTNEVKKYKVIELHLTVEVSGDENGFSMNMIDLEHKLQQELNRFPIAQYVGKSPSISQTEEGFQVYNREANTWSQNYKIVITSEI